MYCITVLFQNQVVYEPFWLSTKEEVDDFMLEFKKVYVPRNSIKLLFDSEVSGYPGLYKIYGTLKGYMISVTYNENKGK